MQLLYKQNHDAFRLLLEHAAAKRDEDPKAKRLTAKQRYDIAMYEDGFIRVQGWIRPEDETMVKGFFHTKAGLDYESGEHLIKKGEKRAKKDDAV